MAFRIERIPTLGDNYTYLVICEQSGEVVVFKYSSNNKNFVQRHFKSSHPALGKPVEGIHCRSEPPPGRSRSVPPGRPPLPREHDQSSPPPLLAAPSFGWASQPDPPSAA